ncbi:MAG: hypothetical protein ACOY90_19250 [Candidatus Zhuqueibacterota bacterium]
MKRSLLLLFLVLALVSILKTDAITTLRESLLTDHKPQALKRQELFDKLSLRYYGTEKYGASLNLVNNHYDVTKFSSGETNIIVPSLDAIHRLYQKQTVLDIGEASKSVAAKSAPEQGSGKHDVEKPIQIAKVDVVKSSMLLAIIGLFLISGILTLVSFCRLQHRIKQKRSQWFPDEDDEPVITDDSILLDFDLSRMEK